MRANKLCDSNIMIYAGSGDYPTLLEYVQAEELAASVVSQIEVLGFHRLTEAARSVFEDIFESLEIVQLDGATVVTAITLRQRRKMSLGDAIIAATALEHDLTLVTRNLKDFRWIAGLRLIDPLAPPS